MMCARRIRPLARNPLSTTNLATAPHGWDETDGDLSSSQKPVTDTAIFWGKVNPKV